MADKVVGLRIQAEGGDQVTQTVGNIKKELKTAQAEAIQLAREFGELSPQATEAAKKVANLKDEIADTNERVKLFDPGAKFQSFTNVLNTAAGGFSALTGAAALFGAESEDLQKTLVKVQGALALSQGLSVIADAGKDFARLKTVAIDALKGIKAGVAATGIGFFAIALGLIVTYWDDIKKLVSGVSAETEKLNKASAKNLEVQKEKSEALEGQDNVLKLQGKSERQILDLKIAQTKEVIKAEQQQIEAGRTLRLEQIAAAERNKKILKGLIDFIAYPIEAVLKFGQDTINNIIGILNKIPGVDLDFKINGTPLGATGDFLSGLVFNPDKIKEEGEAAEKEASKRILALQNKSAGFTLQQREIDKSAAQKSSDEAKKKKEADLKSREDFLAQQRKLNQDSQEQELDDLAEFREQISKSDAEKLKKEQENLKELIKAQDEKDAKEKERQLAAAALDKEIAAQRVANAQIVAGALGTLADIAGRNTAAGKALAVAQASIDGFLGVQKALASAPPPFNFIAAAAVGVATLANVRRIISTKIPGQSGGGGSAPSFNAEIPSIPKPQVAQTSLDRNSLNQIGNAASRAFVVESDVSNSQEKIRRLNRAARLG